MAIAFKCILQKMGHGIFEPVGAPVFFYGGHVYKSKHKVLKQLFVH